MKEKLAIIRTIVEKLSSSCKENAENEELLETLNDELESLEVLARHIDDYDDFDMETWAEELRHLLEEMNE